jgi:hypothetical protein
MAQVIIDINRSGQAQAVFAPSPIDVSSGDQITWRNNDTRPASAPLNFDNPKDDKWAHWPAPVGGGDADWIPEQIPGQPPCFDPPMSERLVTFKIAAPVAPQTVATQEFQYRDATGNTAAIGIIRVWNPKPPAPTVTPTLA